MPEGTAPHSAVGRDYEDAVPMYRYWIKKCQHTAYYRERLEKDSTGWCQEHEVWEPFTNHPSEVEEILPRPVRPSDLTLAVLNPAERAYRLGKVIGDGQLAILYDRALLKNRVKDELVYRRTWTFEDATEVATYLQAQSDLRVAKIAGRRAHRSTRKAHYAGITRRMVEEVMTHLDADLYKNHDSEHHEEDAA